MAVKATLNAEEYEALDPALQEHYTAAADGSYLLDVQGNTPSVTRLEAALTRWKEAAGSSDPRSLEKRLGELRALKEAVGDMDAEGLSAALARLQELEEGGKPDLQAEIARVKEALQKSADKALAEKQDEIQRLTRHIEDREIDQALAAGLEKAEVIPQTREAVKALLKLRGPKVVWEDGKPRGVFTSELGEELDVTTYVEAWAKTDEAKPFLPASGNEGTGAKNSGAAGGGRTNPWKAETFNLTEQAKIVRENPALAKQLASAAGRTLSVA